ncbi:histidine kinase [Nonomuraea sp. NPDC050310]|uniref:sensor histidine kinase n=1 Tax=Nonomuraea sp. NPDC050310 TaxID=3154935 RepID=UPI0034115D27
MLAAPRSRWQRLAGLLRPSHRADLVLALVLTALALLTADGSGPRHPGGEQPSPVAELVRLAPPPPPLPSLPSTGTGPITLPADQSEAPLPLVALTTLPLAYRRRHPVGAFGVVLLAVLIMDGGETWITVLAAAIAAYSAVAHSRSRAVAVAALLAGAIVAGALERDLVPSLPVWLGPYVILISAGALAGLVQVWRQNRERLAALGRERESAMREAVQAERSRIAGELHDVVTHNVSVMLIQAGAARKVMDAHPEQTRRALEAIEASGRAAMAELRNVMGLLAGDEDRARPDGLEPQPGLGEIEDLVERVRAAGTEVDLSLTPPREPLPDGVGLAAYRVVQEALTNTMKHAAGATAAVVVGHDGEHLRIEVTDTGGDPARAVSGNGRGLIGLRERLALYGGTLEAARHGGGFRLLARIPWRSA